tara:strand:- start:194 stop:388 length:195 start_codon:yes stop_codon:yes gene_type:complete
MLVMLGEPHAVVSVATRDCVPKTWNERAFDLTVIALGEPVPLDLQTTTTVVLQAIRKVTRAVSN